MNGSILALMLAGLIGFGAGAYLAATGSRGEGIVLMAGGLAFQVLTLRQLRAAKKGHGDVGSSPEEDAR